MKTSSENRRKIRKWVETAGLTVIQLYGLALCGYLALRWLTGFRLWPVALFSNFLHLALLPALVLLPIMLITRRWFSAGLMGILVAAFGLLFGELFLPQPRNAGAANPALTIMTLNLGADLAQASPEDVVRAVRESGAEVVAFQEVGGPHAEAIRSDLIETYPYQVMYSPGDSVLGIGLISRYPITDDDPFHGAIEWLPYLKATIEKDGQEIQIINVHPPPPALSRDPRQAYRSRSLDDMIQFAAMMESENPTILIGDFNMTDQSAGYVILDDAGLTDAYRQAGTGFGFTYPANRPYGYTDLPSLPVFRIDYIWVNEAFGVQDAWVGENVGSDHLPVEATLVWN